MPIRNKYNILDIISNNETRPVHPYTVLESYFNDHEYWCVQFTSGEHLQLVEQLIPNDVLDEIRFGELYLLLSNNLEGMIESSNYVSELIERLDIPNNKVVFLTGAADAPKCGFKTIITVTFEFLHRIEKTSLATRNNFTKKFIFPNRRWRLHRPMLVALLAGRGLLEHGYVSLRETGDEKSWGTCYDELVNQLPELSTIKDIILSIPDLYIDHTEFKVLYPKELDQTFYNKSCFSIISETNYFSGSSRFLTEKTFKNIDYEIPFILLSRPHSLSLLRDLGYKTFNPYINEDYDLEKDDNKRMLMIADEVERLCNLPDQEMQSLLSTVAPICHYNREVLKNKKYPDDFIWHTL